MAGFGARVGGVGADALSGMGEAAKRRGAVLAVALLPALEGCRYLADDEGIFVNRRDDYLNAEVGAPLRIPPELTEVRILDSWPIPDVRGSDAATNYPQGPPRPEVFVGSDVDAVKIQKLGERSWVVLPDAPEQVWPLIKQFLAENGVRTGREDAPAGVIESAWVVIADRDYDDVMRAAIRSGARAGGPDVAATPTRYRVQFRVERGIRRGSTEVHIDHERIVGTETAAAAPLPAVQSELTARLADFFAHGVAEAVSMVGRDIASASKAQVVKNANGYPSLRLNVDFERAWATVGQALERADVDVAERDRDAAIYRAVFTAGGKARWLKRLVSGRGRDAVVVIHLAREGDAVVVRVQDETGAPVAVELAEHVLLTLREFA